MARQDALSILIADGSAADKLQEEYGKVIENIQHITLASLLKNNDLSGEPTAGSVEAKRFVNVAGKAYGTARSGHAGQKIKADPVTINIDDNIEYIEEVENKDVTMYGVDGLIERRTRDHQNQLAVDLDTKFFSVASTSATAFTTTKTAIEDIIEEAIQTVESTKNNYVNGVPRSMINVVMTPAYYGQLRNKINSIPNSNGLGQVANFEGGIFNNTKIFSSVFLPSGVNYLVMVDGAVAQPVRTSVYAPQKIELSDAVGFGIFTYKGTKAVMPDLIIKA